MPTQTSLLIIGSPTADLHRFSSAQRDVFLGIHVQSILNKHTLERTNGTINNRQFRDTGNIEKKTNKAKNTTHKT